MTTSSADTLVAQGLRAGYRSEVLHGITAEFASGQITVLVGPNGSGKSTFLKALLGLTPLLVGETRLAGQPLPSAPMERARLLAYVPQFESDPGGHSVFQTVLLGRIPWSPGVFETQADLDAAEVALAACDAADLKERITNSLSGGERQRVWLARALAQEARILILDEPTAHLDPAHQVQLVRQLGELADAGRTIILATHDLNWALRVGHQVLALKAGELTWTGEVTQLRESGALEKTFGTPFAWASLENGQSVVVPIS